MIELWIRHVIAKRPYELEALCQRALQTDHPELYVERRGGTGDLGRDLVIKSKRSQIVPHGICQVSAERRWQHKFRDELRALIQRINEGEVRELPPKWVFVTTQEVHERKRPSPSERPRDKDDELAWASGFLQREALPHMEIEIWGFQDLVEVTAHPDKGTLIRSEFGLNQLLGEGPPEWLEAINRFSVVRLDAGATEMPILGHIDRKTDRELLRRSLRDHRAVLVTGLGGTGKTGIVTAEALELIRRREPVLYLRPNSLSPIRSPNDISAEMGIQEPLVQVLRRLAQDAGACYVFLDQMSFALGTGSSRTLCSVAQTASGIEGLYVVVACRTPHAAMMREIQELRFPNVEIRPLARQKVRELLDRLGIAQPRELLLELGGNVLNLRLIAELVRQGVRVGDVSTEGALWKRYVDSVKEREGPHAFRKAVDLATSALQKGRRYFVDMAPDAPTLALIGRGAVVAANGDVYRFMHDKLHDYLYAWEATREQKTAGAVLAEVDQVLFQGVGDWMVQIYSEERPELAVQLAREVLL